MVPAPRSAERLVLARRWGMLERSRGITTQIVPQTRTLPAADSGEERGAHVGARAQARIICNRPAAGV
jgi:hypothetical protein